MHLHVLSCVGAHVGGLFCQALLMLCQSMQLWTECICGRLWRLKKLGPGGFAVETALGIVTEN